MGKRQSNSIDPESSSNVPEAAHEFDVAGPLTLEEAKAVGDVPEDFKVSQSTPSVGGILKHAASAEEGDGVVPSAGDAENPGERKSVTFAEQPPEEIENKERPARRKSLLELLHLKKKKKEVEPVTEAQGEAGKDAQGEEAKAAEPAKVEDTEEAAGDGDSAKPKKRKSVVSSLFHRKEKDGAAQDKTESPDEAAQAVSAAASEAEQVKQTETPGPSAEPQATEAVGGAAAEQAETPPEATASAEQAQGESASASQATEHPPEEKKSFFGRLFNKRSSRASESDDTGAGAALAAGGAATAAGAAATGTAVAQGEDEEKTEAAVDDAVPQATEEPSPPAKKKKSFWASTYPEPSPDAEVMKEGNVRKKGYIFQSFRPRCMRIMSDGTLQYTRREGEWEDAKGLKLSHDMDLESQENTGKHLHTLKVNVPGCKSCVFGFEAVEDRDSWRGAFEEIRTKLQASAPDDGSQHVMKSGALGDEAPGTSSNGAKEEVTA